TCAAVNFYNNINLDPKNWETTALIAKWAIDQLTAGVVSVNLGNNVIQFTKQPDGRFTPPQNCTMSLTSSGGGYNLQERHGRTFKFGSNGLLTTIVDQYNQSNSLSYNSGGLLTNVTDWKGHSLTFNYTSGVLTSVSDSTGRSVSYNYTGGDLTSYSDPEQKSTSYAYDTDHEIIATFDGLSRMVVSNIYDGFGHVVTQVSQGDTTKTWQIYPSGYYTLEIDPVGDQREFTYHGRSRMIAFQDALGNVSQTAYDGQDHVVQTVSPLN